MLKFGKIIAINHDKHEQAIYFHQGCISYYDQKIAELGPRIEKGKAGGAENVNHKFHQLYETLVAEMRGFKIRRQIEVDKVKSLQSQK